MDAEEIWRNVDEQRAELADLIEVLDAAQWATPSLCDGWRVGDVAAHLTHSHMPAGRILVEAVKSGFRLDAMLRRLAIEDTRSPKEVATALRGMIGARKKVPGTSVEQPLIEVLTHGQDMAVPLGIDLPMPTAAAVAAAERLAGMKFPMNGLAQLDGVRLVATDADFTAGEGQEVRAPIRDIVMILGGRAQP